MLLTKPGNNHCVRALMLLYHYCSNYAFFEILKSKVIRLSPLGFSNDSKEGHHVLDVAERLVPRTSGVRNTIREDLATGITRHEVLGFCLSEKPDVLSQWRGYSDDARGIAIGFDRNELQKAADVEKLYLQKVVYKKSHLVRLMKPALRKIFEHEESMPGPYGFGGPRRADTSEERERYYQWERRNEELYDELAVLSYAFKSEFFEEEMEWRIFKTFPVSDGQISIPNVQFLVSTQLFKPFVTFPCRGFKPSLVKEIVLGPRNQTPPNILRLFLDEHGFGHAVIKQSLGTYR